MKSGTYQMTVNVQLTDCETEEEAVEAVKDLFLTMFDDGEFPEVTFELLEELDVEYTTEEDEVPELNFELNQ